MGERIFIGVAQIESEPANLQTNLGKARKAVIEAGSKGAQIVCFPELFPSGYCLEELGGEITTFYRRHYQSIVRFFSEAARRSCLHIVLPTAIPRENGVLENGLLCFAPSGEIAGTHSKYHLWGNEKKYFTAGAQTLFIKVGNTSISFAVCYDLGFPEVCRYLGRQASVVIAPSAWDISGFRLWELNLSQRAAENTVFTVGVNAVGTFKGARLFGRSMLCGPTGDILSELPSDTEKVDVFMIDTDALESAREFLPYTRDRRPDLYSSWFAETQEKPVVSLRKGKNPSPSTMIE